MAKVVDMKGKPIMQKTTEKIAEELYIKAFDKLVKEDKYEAIFTLMIDKFSDDIISAIDNNMPALKKTGAPLELALGIGFLSLKIAKEMLEAAAAESIDGQTEESVKLFASMCEDSIKRRVQ
jgi:hypothetical protein